MKKKKWKRTLGERLMQIPGPEPLPNGYEDLWWSKRLQARRIDAAIRRAVRSAVREAFRPSLDASREYREAERNRVAKKYGVRL